VITYPSAVDYALALRNGAAAFADASLRTATFAPGLLGPSVIFGSNAVVFHATIGGKEYALRCYTRQGVWTPEGYAAINSFVASNGLSRYIADVTWHNEAVQVMGASWPVLQMEWIDGQQLHEYVGYLADSRNGEALGTLAAEWRGLIALLQRGQFAHGNLEHGNILIDRQGQLRLVDYDTVWIPQLAGESPHAEHGHPNYQHPGPPRWGRWADNFPALVIYLALVALGKGPGLWQTLNTGDNLLFTRSDFFPPFRTEIWKQLAALGDPQVDELARRLQECCAPDWVPTKSLEEMLGMPVTIYLSDESIHQQVETALEALLDVAGWQIESRGNPVIGSWFRNMGATVKQVVNSPAGREATLVAAHIADTRLVLAQDAAVTATLMQNLGPVIGALQPTKDAVVRVGALLIVKVNWVVNVFQLTAAQQFLLDHRPQLSCSPDEIIATLNLIPASSQDGAPPALQ
jgi:hypothetical protein